MTKVIGEADGSPGWIKNIGYDIGVKAIRNVAGKVESALNTITRLTEMHLPRQVWY